MARKNVQKNTFDSTLAKQITGKTIENPLEELPWNQQNSSWVVKLKIRLLQHLCVFTVMVCFDLHAT